jgi:hypothetical protein
MKLVTAWENEDDNEKQTEAEKKIAENHNTALCYPHFREQQPKEEARRAKQEISIPV